MVRKLIFDYASGDYGWSELFYTNVAGTLKQVSQFYARSAYVDARRAVSPPTVKILGVTAYDEEVRRKGAYTKISENGNFTFGQEDPVKNAYYQEVCALLLLSSSDGDDRRLWCRGMPHTGLLSKTTGSGVVEVYPTSFLEDKINDLCEIINDSNFNIKKLLDEDARPAKTVLYVGRDSSDPRVYIQTAEPHGFDVGDQVYFLGMNQCVFGFLKGEWTVVETSQPTLFRINQLFPATTAQFMTAGPPSRVRIAEYDYPTISTAEFLEMSDHDTGKKQGLPRGRTSGRRCRQSTHVVVPSPE